MCQEKDPLKALAVLRNAYPNREDSMRAMSMWKRVRMTILHHEANRNFSFPDQVREIIPTCTREDQVKLEDLIEFPCVEQHKILSSNLPYLGDLEADMLVKQCSPMMQEFYEFSFPDDMFIWAKELTAERNTKALYHKIKPQEDYNITREEINTIIEKCKDVISYPSISNSKKYYEMVVAIQILTGRRPTEILNAVTFYPSSHRYQAQVTGLLKNTTRMDDIISIPLLAPFPNIERGFRMLREFKNFSDMTNVEISNGTHGSIDIATKRLFGRRLTHTQKRNIYCETAYDRRHTENEFLPNVSKQVWIASALGHSLTSKLGTTERYQLMQIF